MNPLPVNPNPIPLLIEVFASASCFFLPDLWFCSIVVLPCLDWHLISVPTSRSGCAFACFDCACIKTRRCDFRLDTVAKPIGHDVDVLVAQIAAAVAALSADNVECTSILTSPQTSDSR